MDAAQLRSLREEIQAQPLYGDAALAKLKDLSFAEPDCATVDLRILQSSARYSLMHESGHEKEQGAHALRCGQSSVPAPASRGSPGAAASSTCPGLATLKSHSNTPRR